MMLTGNKGEWSELYVLIKLLSEGKLYQSDYNLNIDPENVYDICKAYKSENGYSLTFSRKDELENGKVVVTRVDPDNVEQIVCTFSYDDLKRLSKSSLSEIKIAKGNSFNIEGFNNFIKSSQIGRISEKSDSKSDIKLRIYDHRLAKETDLGFSIKSLLGGNSTLFNAGNGNNFIFHTKDQLQETVESFNQRSYKPKGGLSKITYRLQELKRLNIDLRFKDIQSDQLWRNLKMIDGDLPEILAWALYYRYLERESKVSTVCEILEQKDPLGYYGDDKVFKGQKMYEHKLKRFLAESAMGMTSETIWYGEYDSFGGVIIPKQDGEVVCFHIYDFNLFRNYLLNNTQFEQASTGEDENRPGTAKAKAKKKFYFGWLYEEFDEFRLKLQLQIRFK